MKDEATKAVVETVGAAVGSKATYAGAGVSAASWWLSSEAGVLFGILLGTLGLAVNVYFKCRKDHRERESRRRDEARKEELHAAQLAAIKERCDVN